MRYEVLKRLVAKLVHDVLPAVLASLIGGLLFTQFQLGRAPALVGAQVAAPASPEMMQLLRDEHGLIVNYLTAQVANEKKQLAAADEGAPRAAADSQPATAPATPVAAPRPANVVSMNVKASALRSKAAMVGASLPPLVVADPQQSDSVQPVAPDEDSLFARTIGIRDHVIAVTQRAASAIGGIPSWFGSIGDRIGGDDANPRPPADLVSAS
jgi:hypothetical protein